MDYNPLTLVMNVFIMIISFYLLFLYIKSPTFRSYPLYNNMILSFCIFLDNAFRLIHFPENSKLCDTQAYLLVFLDKFLLIALTFYAFLLYLIVIHTKFYTDNEKKIFFINLFLNIGISLIITIIFMFFNGTTYYGPGICYCDDIIKKLPDTIITFVLIVINIFCLLKLLIYLSEKIKEVSIGQINDLNYGKYYTKILFMFFINGSTLMETLSIINNFIDGEYIDLLYVSTYLIVDLVYTLNETVYKMTLQIFCVKIYNKKYPSIKRGDTLSDDDDSPKNSRTSSLSES